jgi:hypothetical protein
MLQNTVTDIADLANIKQLSDQMVARGDPPLTFKGYIELLLLACSTFDKSNTSTRQSGQRNVYAATMEYNKEVCYDSNNTEIFHVDTDTLEIVANTTTTQSMARSPSIGRNTSFIPQEEWLKISPKQRTELLAKQRKERVVQQGSYQPRNIPVRHVNLHDTQEVANLDEIIEYTANTHVVCSDGHGIDAHNEESTDILLAHMAGRVSAGTSPGDIWNILAAKQRPTGKGRSVKLNEASMAPDTFSLGDTTYYLNKGE